MSTPPVFAVVLLSVTAASSVLGCGASVTPIDVAPGCPEQPDRGPLQFASEPHDDLIDDFENDSNYLPRLGGRDGAWVLGTDLTTTHFAASVSAQCAGRGHHAGHFTGSGFSSWGANWTAVLRSDSGGTAVAYDATPYGGISFWAAVSSTAAAPFTLPAGVTTMEVAWNGGICTKCMDYYRTTITLEHAWHRFEVRFSDLAQSGTGDPIVALHANKLVGLILWPDRDFDVWIDDVRFEP